MSGHRVEANEIIRLSGLYGSLNEAIAEALADRDRELKESLARCYRAQTSSMAQRASRIAAERRERVGEHLG